MSNISTVVASPRNVVVTGANRGLGYELVRKMCSMDDIGSIYALCRRASAQLSDLSEQSTKVIVVEDVDVTKDDVGLKLQMIFQSQDETGRVPIDLLIHNAGAYGPPEDFADERELRASQTLSAVTMDRVRGALEINTLGPLKVTQALLPNLKATTLSAAAERTARPKRIIIISSAMGSVEENGSGGHYGYRTSKAGANMIGKTLAMDLKNDNICVGMIHPGYVLTGFDNNKPEDKPHERRNPGQRDVGPSATGVLQAIEKVNMDTTGSFWHGNYGEGVKTMPW